MGVFHIARFKFRPEIDDNVQKDNLSSFLSLKQSCKDPVSGESYIRDLAGGVHCSPGDGTHYTHAFILKFDSLEEREYYAKQDPTHLDFKSRIFPLLENVEISAFEDIRA